MVFFLFIGIIFIIVIMLKFNKSTGVSYKSELFRVLKRLNNYEENNLTKFEVISSKWPGMWALHTHIYLAGKEVEVEKQEEMRVDEILAFLLSYERKYLKLPEIKISEVIDNIDFYIKENDNAFKDLR